MTTLTCHTFRPLHSILAVLLLAAVTIPASAQMATTSTGKFVGNILKITTTVDPDFDTYWNQATPENSGKWGQVEGTRDVMNWTTLDFIYNYTRTRGIPFKLHTLIWGQDYPAWMDSLPANEQREEVEEWIAALGDRYPGVEFIDVVNEAIPGHAPAPFRDALGGSGTTGWDWVIWSFEKARQYFPNAQLHLNDYNVISSDSTTTTYLTMINLLKERGLIDGIGEQAHNFESTSLTTLQNNLNRLAATGLPIYISELEIAIANDANQLSRYQQLFPIFWTNPSVRGITLWGYKQGQMWRNDGYLLGTNGSERPALTWMKNYIAANPQSFSAAVTAPANGQGLSNVSPVSASATVSYGTAPYNVTFQKKLDSESEFTTVSSDATAPYTADLGMLPVGTYQVRVVVTDADSEMATSAPNTFTVYPAAGGTWLGTSGNWDDPAIWVGGTIANGADATASFTGVDIAADQTITLNGSRAIGNIVFTDATTPSHNLTISGADILTLDLASGAPVINVSQADRRLSLTSVVAGNDGLQKDGPGQLTLSGNNTYTGTTTISAGELRLSGGAFSTTAGRTYQIDSGALMSFGASATIASGTYTTIQGTGTLRVLNGVNLSAGGSSRKINMNLGAGALIDVQAGGQLGSGYQPIVWTNNRATLNLDGNHDFWDDNSIFAAALTGSGTIASTHSTGSTSLTLGVSNGSGTFGGSITAAGTRVISLVKNGTGTQTFSGSTTFRGTTTINGGTLHYAKAASLYAGVATDWVKTKVIVNNGGTIAFNVGGTNEFTESNVTAILSGLGGAVNNNGLRAGSTLAFDTTNASGGTFSVADAIANSTGTGGGAIGLRKLGANTLVLSNANTYTGPTNVDQGTLAVTGSLGATAVNVSGGILTGNGNFGGNVTIGPGAMISLAVAFDPASQDTSAITGTLALAQSTINLTAESTPFDGVYVLATATAAITGSPDFINYNGITGTVSVDNSSTPKRLLLTVTGSPPSLSAAVTAPTNGQVVSNVLPVTASATVTYGTAPFTVTFQKKLDSESEFATVSSDDTAPYTANLGVLPVGTYQIRVVVTDSDSATVTSTPNTFAVTLPDQTAPTPNPMTFESPPAATGQTSITMAATTASDPSGVEYRFNNLTLASSSAWQDSPVYTATGLTPATSYTFTVQARDKSPAQNTTAASGPASATTVAPNSLPPSLVRTASASGFGSPSTININAAVTGGNVLVVGAYADAGNAGSAVSITFGGNAPTGRRNSDRGFMAYYKTNALDTTVAISLSSGASSVGLVLWELSNVDLTAGVVGGTGDTITTTAANTFVVGTGFRNGTLISYNEAAVFDTLDIPVFVVTGAGGAVVAQTGSIGGASGLAVTAGSQNISWNNDADGSALAFGFVSGSVAGPGPVASFAISPIASPQTVGTPITGITLTAKDASNATATSFTGTVTFGGTAGITGTSANFTAGVLTGVSVTPTVAGSNLTFTVDDGSGHSGSATIATIQTPYETWAAANAPASAAGEDFDNDGVPNAIEFVLGGDKDTNDLGKLPAVATPGADMTFTFVRDQASIDPSVSVEIAVGPDLATWPGVFTVGADTASSTEGITVTDNLDGTDTITLSIPREPGTNKFARLVVVITP